MGTLGEGGGIEGEEFVCGWVSGEGLSGEGLSGEGLSGRGDRWEGRRWYSVMDYASWVMR